MDVGVGGQIGRSDAGADGGVTGDRAAWNRNRPPFHLQPHPFGDSHPIFRAVAGEQAGKLLASVAGDEGIGRLDSAKREAAGPLSERTRPRTKTIQFLQMAATISSLSPFHFFRYSRRSLLYLSTSWRYSSLLPCRS